MALEYISDTIDRVRFLEKTFQKSQSERAVDTILGHLANLDYYTEDVYHTTTDKILIEMSSYIHNKHSIAKVLRYLDDYVQWLQLDHENIIVWKGRNKKVKTFLHRKQRSSIPSYFSTARKYLSLVGGIRIHDDDIKMSITKPKPKGHYEDEDAMPLSSPMAQRVIEETKQKIAKSFLMVSNDTAFRMAEGGQIQEKHIDFTKSPVEIHLPQENSKGKNAGGTRYLRDKTAKYLKQFCTGEPERYVYVRGPMDTSKNRKVTLRNFGSKTLARIRVVYTFLGKEEFPEMLERNPETGRYNFNIHSWRKRCATEYARENGEALAHGYIRHTKYLAMYIVKTKEERIANFIKSQDDLAPDGITKNLSKANDAKKKLKLFNAEKDKMLDSQQAKIDELTKQLDDLKKSKENDKSSVVADVLKELEKKGVKIPIEA